MDDPPVEEYERRSAERRRKAERRLGLLVRPCPPAFAALLGLLLARDEVRLTS